MNFFLTLLIALALTNIIHYILHVTSKYIISFAATLWFKHILRKKYYTPPSVIDYYDKTLQEQDIIKVRYICSMIFWNIFVTMCVLAQPLSLIRFISLIPLMLVFHAIGLIRIFEEEGINEQYRKYNVDTQHKDYERRNVVLANAIVSLEKDNARLRKIAGEPIRQQKNIIRGQIRI